MTMKNIIYTFLIGVTLVACSQMPKQAYFTRGQPESLLESSSEVVSLVIDSKASVQDITRWISNDQPTRAELNCSAKEALCIKVQKVLHQFSVPMKYTAGHSNTVALIYERVLARDCENRYIDNPANSYNLNHQSFGCSVASNIVQMVSEKRQFTNPALMENPDADKAVQAIGFYKTPAAFTPTKTTGDFKPIVTQEIISTGSGGSGGGGGR